jgi:valyl-tRNA synthetase
MEDLTNDADKHYSRYDFYNPSTKLRYFLWEIFASHYIEVVKSRAYNQEKKFSKSESDSAKHTLYFLLERLLVLFYPVIPQVTTTIAKEMKIDLLKESFPKFKLGKNNLELVEKIMAFNSKVWKQKKEKGISLRDKIIGKVPKELKNFEKDLVSCHKLV